MDWRGLMAAGLHELQLHPRDFWALTPAELQLMLGAARGFVPMARDRLDALLLDFPDLEKGDWNG